ncbi:NAD-dependent epimerase/dehydratase family protein [Lysobacter sp. 5GHs7-4]|uniref:NAD-dependent epimerase/dehydratase family protein n=1 Tax=Lysobacter sp. 5GHs7-4 TaxID=2904253 RepID=UPI001E283FDB|nr:NAD-dependent epimerase/dehydratase family protein [Lysobacter sp. 5GHs7-4]UHQ22690.1 NAD-dependent epimerase/dehydratase family protein [Lysobacter sp. 5GHs7-4]
MRVLLIGGNGFIGSHLVDGLRAAGHTVSVLDPRAPRADADWRGVEYRQAAYSDRAAIDAMLDGCDVVLHLASTTVPSTSNLDPVRDVSTNLVDTLGLIASMRERGLRRIVFFSSGGTVYGNPDRLPVDETHPLRPISSYGVVKVAIEHYLLMYHALGDLDPLILRPSNPYGPRQIASGQQGFIATALACAHQGLPLRIWGGGNTVRDYLYIDDLTDLVVRAVNGSSSGVYNVGSGAGHSLNAVLAAVERVTGRTIRVEHLPERGFDVREVVLDIAAASARFGWRPQVELEQGIALTWHRDG